MPLTRIEHINGGRYLGIWHIDESYETLYDELGITIQDLDLLSHFRLERKRLEWLAGRLAIRSLCEHVNMPYHGVKKDEYGKPWLIDSPRTEISLTHSFPYVAAVLDPSKPVGIDLEQPKEKLIRVAHKFLSEEELEFLKGNVQKLCVAWCAKEALYKLYSKKQLLFKEHMKLAPFDICPKGIITGNIIVNGSIKTYKLEYTVTQDYVLVYNID